MENVLHFSISRVPSTTAYLHQYLRLPPFVTDRLCNFVMQVYLVLPVQVFRLFEWSYSLFGELQHICVVYYYFLTEYREREQNQFYSGINRQQLDLRLMICEHDLRRPRSGEGLTESMIITRTKVLSPNSGLLPCNRSQ